MNIGPREHRQIGELQLQSCRARSFKGRNMRRSSASSRAAIRGKVLQDCQPFADPSLDILARGRGVELNHRFAPFDWSIRSPPGNITPDLNELFQALRACQTLIPDRGREMQIADRITPASKECPNCSNRECPAKSNT